MDARASKNLALWTVAVALMVALTGLAFAGCGSDPKALALTAADNGNSYTVQVGDTITVTLEGNPTTGYTWTTDTSQAGSSLLTMIGTEPAYTQTETASDVVGAGGSFTFEFKAAAAGQEQLTLKYWRSFEPDAEPQETFSVDLTIE